MLTLFPHNFCLYVCANFEPINTRTYAQRD